MRVVLCVDAETLNYFSPGPWQSRIEKVKWFINNQLWGLRYAQGYDGLINLLNMSTGKKLPMTVFAVEHIRKWITYNITRYPFIDLGSHSASHKCLLTMTDKELEEEFEKIEPCTSFAAPMNMIEDSNNPDRVFKHLKKKRIKIIRYQGMDDVVMKGGRHCNQIYFLSERFGIKTIHGTNYFEGTSSNSHIQEILDDLKEHHYYDDSFIYCLSTHDFTWKESDRWKFRKVIDYIQAHFKVTTLAELSNEK